MRGRTAPDLRRWFDPVPAPDVVVLDHNDSYTWNLVHLIASVTGVLPEVVQHDEVAAADLLAHDHVVLSPGPGNSDHRKDFSVGREVMLAGHATPLIGHKRQAR